MEVARLAALRGHRVTLLDEKDKPGGMVNLAIIPPYKEELNNIIDYYSHQMEILDVDLNLGKTVTPEQLKEIQPDVVVLATGAMEALPDIPGIEGENVVTASDILSGAAPAGEKVVIIGGGMIGVETAEFLADGNKDVTVIEMLKSVATDIGPTSRWGLLSRVRKKVRILTSMQVTQVRAVNPENQEKEIPADTVVVATELRGRDDLRSFLEQSGIEHYLVGSCKNPGQIATAIAEGFDVGCKI
jgi:NADPH-dependent 2,4-dienoyl-CoA reductase/sulfur reductase-like enzyme